MHFYILLYYFTIVLFYFLVLICANKFLDLIWFYVHISYLVNIYIIGNPLPQNVTPFLPISANFFLTHFGTRHQWWLKVTNFGQKHFKASKTMLCQEDFLLYECFASLTIERDQEGYYICTFHYWTTPHFKNPTQYGYRKTLISNVICLSPSFRDINYPCV